MGVVGEVCAIVEMLSLDQTKAIAEVITTQKIIVFSPFFLLLPSLLFTREYPQQVFAPWLRNVAALHAADTPSSAAAVAPSQLTEVVRCALTISRAVGSALLWESLLSSDAAPAIARVVVCGHAVPGGRRDEPGRDRRVGMPRRCRMYVIVALFL